MEGWVGVGCFRGGVGFSPPQPRVALHWSFITSLTFRVKGISSPSPRKSEGSSASCLEGPFSLSRWEASVAQ